MSKKTKTTPEAEHNPPNLPPAQQIPKGYMMDGRGNLVAIKNIKLQALAADRLVRKLFHAAQKAALLANQTRDNALQEIHAHVHHCAEIHGVALGGEKGNVTLSTYDGTLRVTRARAERIGFTEEIAVARDLIRSCFQRFSKGASSHLRAIVNSAFEVDDQGDVKVAKIIHLSQIKIDDPDWNKAMSIIKQAMQVTGTQEYVRFHKRNPRGQYERLHLGEEGSRA